MAISQLTLNAIQAEGHKQDLKWGEQNTQPVQWLAILVEEVGELAQAILADQSATPELHDSHHVSMEIEAIQIAAVAGHFIEYLSRRKTGPGDVAQAGCDCHHSPSSWPPKPWIDVAAHTP